MELTTTNNVKSPMECPFDQDLALVHASKRGDAAASMIRPVELTAFVLVLVVVCVEQDGLTIRLHDRNSGHRLLFSGIKIVLSGFYQ